MKVKVYPAILKECDEGFSVFVPDYNITVTGKGLEEALFNARIKICLSALNLLREVKVIPEPSKISDIKCDGVPLLVDVDFGAYAKIIDSKTVRRNCSLPAWLDEKAEKSGINVSSLLQSALKKELGLIDPDFGEK